MKFKLSSTAISVGAALLCTVAFQPGAVAADDQASGDEKLVVTGSRIRQTQLEGSAPVRIIDREEIDASGLTSIGDLLQQLSSSGSAINTRFNSSGNFGFPPDGGGIGAGATEVDLRHLGSNRVLVLVDGVRWVNGSSASGVSNATDLNTIPLSAVDHIEVLEDGASAIYGSDAIAGVINIITKKDFEGLSFNAYGGTYDQGDGETNSFDITVGSVSQSSRFLLSLSHFEQRAVSAADRSLARTPAPLTPGGTHGSSATPFGRFVFVDPNSGVVSLTVNDGVTGIPVYDTFNPGGPNDDFHPFTNDDRFNYATYNLYVTPNRRNNIFASAELDVSDHVTFYTRAMYNNRKSTNQAAPEPIFIGPDAGTGGLGDVTTIDVTNPYNPFGFTLDASNFIFAGRRPIEGGPRVFKQNVNTAYINTGVKGDWNVGDRVFAWDVNYVWSTNRADQIKTGGYNSRHIQLALGPLATCQATPGCVPLNIFGAGTITQDMLDWISFTQKDVSENNLSMFSANLTGDLFAMPAGMAGFAIGVESRNQDGFFQPDAVVVAGESNGVPSSPTAGEFDVDELYAEFRLPLLDDEQKLDLSLAVRYSDYSTSGDETTHKVGVRWEPTPELVVRGSVSTGFRAPGIGELFSTGSRFDAVLTDPCQSPANSTIDARCQALGVPAGGYIGTGGQISVTTGGNPNLQAETSDSQTFGFVYSPAFMSDLDWVETFSVAATWYDHEVDGAIQAIDAQTQLNECILNANDLFCSGISRTASGTINGFQNRLVNIGGIKTSGYDLKIRYQAPTQDWGQIGLTWNNTFVSKYEETVLGVTNDLAGIERNDSAIPEWKFDLTIDWKRGDWGASWTTRYVDAVTESCSNFQDGSPISFTALGLCSQPNTANEALSKNELDASMVHDLQVTWRPSGWGHDVRFAFGVENVFDEDPPACMSCSLNGYDPSTYWPQGQFYYLRASYNL